MGKATARTSSPEDNKSPELKWPDEKKFWFETARTSAFAIVGLITTIYILMSFEQRSQYQATVDREKLSIQRGVIDDFLKTSYLYSALTYDVLDGIDNKQVSYKEWNEMNERWQGGVYDDYRSNRNRIKTYFEIQRAHDSSIDALLEQAENNREAMKKYYESHKPKNEKHKAAIQKQKKSRAKKWQDDRNQFKDSNNAVAAILLRTIGISE